MRKARFDSDEVVEKAMHVFWQQGYSGASMQNIFAATGLKPGSIYLAFGNKDGLYEAAMSRYVKQSLEFIEATIAEAVDIRVGICRVLNAIIDESSTEDFCSCFLVKSWLELPKSSELHGYAGSLLESVEACYRKHLLQVFSPELAKAHATSLMLHIFGIRVYCYHESSKEKLRDTLIASLPWLSWEGAQ